MIIDKPDVNKHENVYYGRWSTVYFTLEPGDRIYKRGQIPLIDFIPPDDMMDLRQSGRDVWVDEAGKRYEPVDKIN